MANTQIGNPLNVVDKRATASANTTSPIATEANYVDVAAMRTRLNAISAGTYTAARMDTMTANDMVYAIRVSDDAAGI